jgi:uncharacterized cupredoxin-like copper-binding protein
MQANREPRSEHVTPRGAADVLTRPTTAALALAATAVLALAGCGSSSSKSTSSESTPAAPAATQTSSTSSAPATGGGGATSQLSLGTNPEGQLKFDKSTLSAKAGKLSIAYENKSPLEHNLTIESSSGASVGATETFTGGSKTLTVTLKAGNYKFYCSVPGHRQAGMEGTLTVK